MSYMYADSISKMYGEVVFIGRGENRIGSRVKFCPVNVNINYDSRFKALYFLKSGLLSFIVSLKALKYLRTNRVSIVHSNSSITTSLVKLFFRDIPIVYTIHDQLSIGEKRIAGIERIERKFINNILELHSSRVSDRIIAVSDLIKTQLVKCGISSKKISVLYTTSTLETEALISKDKFYSDLGENYILSVGRQDGRKRFDKLIQAMSKLSPKINLILVGNGPNRSNLENLVKKLNLTDRVFFRDFVSSTELLSLYSNSSLYAMVSDREGFPISIVEALFSGTRAAYFTGKENIVFPSIPDSDYLQIYDSTEPNLISEKLESMILDGEYNHKFKKEEIIDWAKSIFPTQEGVAIVLNEVYSTCRKSDEEVILPQAV